MLVVFVLANAGGYATPPGIITITGGNQQAMAEIDTRLYRLRR
jgi:hypothetical protein